MSEIVHMELNTSDPKGAKKFYKSVFGWKFQDMKMPEGVYTMIMGKNGPLGGLQQKPMPEAPNHWLGYYGVPSVTKTITKVKKQGGAVIMPKIDVPGPDGRVMGSLAIFTDPQGAAFAVWEAGAAAAAQSTTKQSTTKRSTKKRSTKKRSTKKGAAKKSSKKAAKKSSKKAAKKSSKKAAKKSSKKAARKTSKKAARKSSKKAARKSSEKAARKSSKKR